MWTQEELDDVVGVEPRLVLACCNVQDPHSTCRCFEEGPMGGNPTVQMFWSNKNF